MIVITIEIPVLGFVVSPSQQQQYYYSCSQQYYKKNVGGINSIGCSSRFHKTNINQEELVLSSSSSSSSLIVLRSAVPETDKLIAEEDGEEEQQKLQQQPKQQQQEEKEDDDEEEEGKKEEITVSVEEVQQPQQQPQQQQQQEQEVENEQETTESSASGIDDGKKEIKKQEDDTDNDKEVVVAVYDDETLLKEDDDNTDQADKEVVAVVVEENKKEEEEEEEEEEEKVSVDDETLFKIRTKELCEERNIGFDKIKNARDLASVKHSPIAPGKLYRTGRVSDASDDDIELLLKTLGVKTLIDLRSPTELKDDPTLMRMEVFQNFTNVVWKESRRAGRRHRDGHRTDGCIRELGQDELPVRNYRAGKNKDKTDDHHDDATAAAVAAVTSYTAPVDTAIVDDKLAAGEEEDVCVKTTDHHGDDNDDCHDEHDDEGNHHKYVRVSEVQYDGNRKERLFISLMNELKYVRGTLSKIRKRDLAKCLLKAPGTVFSRRVRNSFKKPFLAKINGGGLLMMNELLLRYGAPGIKYTLQICADETRHPIAFYCTAGKDRTGMIAALILSLCGASYEDIVEDYSLSANVYAEMNDHTAMVGALSQRSLDPQTFLGAPPQIMKDTLDTIRDQYGSVEGYCNWIGFGPEQQQKLREVLKVDKANGI